MNETIEFQLNGQPVRLDTTADRSLLWTLRTDLALTGAKCGCGIGLCGACTVLVNRKASRACLLTLQDVRGKEVLTIEGLANGDKLHPLQQAFVDRGAMQCGFCTPGMILNAYGLLLERSEPTESEVISRMNGNLCRCGAHPRIVQAIMSAVQMIKGGAK